MDMLPHAEGNREASQESSCDAKDESFQCEFCIQGSLVAVLRTHTCRRCCPQPHSEPTAIESFHLREYRGIRGIRLQGSSTEARAPSSPGSLTRPCRRQ